MLKKILLGLFGLLVLLLVLTAGVLLYANTDSGKRHISQIATNALDREVELKGGIGFLPAWPPTLRVTELRIANFEGGRAENMADIGRFEISVKPLPLLIGDLVFPKIVLVDSQVSLERKGDGDANWSLGKEKPERGNQDEADMPVIGQLHIENSSVAYLDALQDIDINIEARTEGENIHVSGKGNYQKNPFLLKATGGSLLTVQEDKPFPVDIALNIGHTDIKAKGTVQDPTNFAGMDINLSIKGGNAADLFPIFGIALPPTPPYEVTGQLNYADAIWRFNPFKGTMGNSDIGGDLTWDPTGDRPKLTAHFVSQKLDFNDLGPLIGLAPEEAVTPEQKAEAAKQAQSPRAIPDVPLDVSRLSAMDADVTLTGKSIIAPGWPLDDFFLHVTLDDRILRIDPVKFGTAKGNVALTMRVDSRQQPMAAQADFRFTRLSLNELLGSLGEAEGYIGGAAKLEGKGASLHEILSTSNGTVGIGMDGGRISHLLVELAGLDVFQSVGVFLGGGDRTVAVNCILGHFDVKDGVLNSKTLVIDTDDTNIQGEGTIDLETEAMNLRFVPQPKDVSLVSLRTPITVKGTLKSPSPGVEAMPLAARGGAALALSAVLTPVAGILAFIDPGQGKDSNCKALIAQAKAETTRKGEKALIPANENTSKAVSEPAKPAETPQEEVNPKSEALPPAVKRDVQVLP
ncbi:MAG: AsmA family protein [Alphaproteobacteria bacterium]|nr:AsmA family protein [Alphaproteobacteria bacterium]